MATFSGRSHNYRRGGELSSSDQEESEPPRSKVNGLRLEARKARKQARTQKSPNFLLHPKMFLTTVSPPQASLSEQMFCSKNERTIMGWLSL